jgi:prepilin signal peptidase PulO-like enzyme (type II secretory pathway)
VVAAARASDRRATIPFGPALAAGTVVALLLG